MSVKETVISEITITLNMRVMMIKIETYHLMNILIKLNSRRLKYQENLETPLKRSDFIFDLKHHRKAVILFLIRFS